MGFNNVNMNVSGPKQPTSTYKTKILKGNHSFASQVTEPNIKYVIKHDFDLGGENVTIPENCVLEFDGGILSNGTINLSSNTKITNGLLNRVHLTSNSASNISIVDTIFSDDLTLNHLNFITFDGIENIEFRNVTFENWRGPIDSYATELIQRCVLHINHSTNILWDNVTVQNTGLEGAFILNSDNIQIYNCIFDLDRTAGGWTPLNIFYCNNVVVKNILTKTRMTVSSVNILANNVLFEDCRFVGGKGIDLGDELAYEGEGMFERENNTFRSCYVESYSGEDNANIYFLYFAGDGNSSVLKNLYVEGCTFRTRNENYIVSNAVELTDNFVQGEIVFDGCTILGVRRFLYYNGTLSNLRVSNCNIAIHENVSNEPILVSITKLGESSQSVVSNIKIVGNIIESVKDLRFTVLATSVSEYAAIDKCVISNNYFSFGGSVFRAVNFTNPYTTNIYCEFNQNIIVCTKSENYNVFEFSSPSVGLMICGNKFYDLGLNLQNLRRYVYFKDNEFISLRTSNNIAIGGAYFEHVHFINNSARGNIVITKSDDIDTIFQDFVFDSNVIPFGNNYLKAALLTKGNTFVPHAGTTEERPTFANIFEGYGYFDKTLGKEIYAKTIEGQNITWSEEDGVVAGIARQGTFMEKPVGNKVYNGFRYMISEDNPSRYMPIYYNGSYWVNAIGERMSWEVTFDLTNLRVDNESQPENEKTYQVQLKGIGQYARPANIVVKMGATTLTLNTDYTYNASHGFIKVLGIVTGNITIEAVGVLNS